MQTKEQSIGYILKATIDSGSTAKELRDLYYKLDEAISDHIEVNGPELDNYSTYDFMVFINRESGASEEKIKEIGSNLYYAFDMYTVNEAGEFYNAFKVILRIFD